MRFDMCLDLLRDSVTSCVTASGMRRSSKHCTMHLLTSVEIDFHTVAYPSEKNIMLADLVEEEDCCHAGAEDVACDVCAGLKVESHCILCLLCKAIICEQLLQLHYLYRTVRKHKHVNLFKKLQKKHLLSSESVESVLLSLLHG